MIGRYVCFDRYPNKKLSRCGAPWHSSTKIGMAHLRTSMTSYGRQNMEGSCLLGARSIQNPTSRIGNIITSPGRHHGNTDSARGHGFGIKKICNNSCACEICKNNARRSGGLHFVILLCIHILSPLPFIFHNILLKSSTYLGITSPSS